MDELDSLDFYRILKAAHENNSVSSPQIELDINSSDEKIEQLLLKGVEKEYFLTIKDSDPKKYKINYEKLVEVWKNVWYENLDEVPPLPESFEEFLENYIKSYLNEEDYSTLKEMLYKQFYLGLSKVSSERSLSNDYRELKNTLSKGFEDKKKPAHHIRNGLRNR